MHAAAVPSRPSPFATACDGLARRARGRARLGRSRPSPSRSCARRRRLEGLPREAIRGSGYAESLEAALGFAHTTSEDAVLAAANLGDDADTTAARSPAAAGAHYGAI